MITDEIIKYISRMNESGNSHYKGLTHCYILSEEPIIIAYDFDSGLNAAVFILTRQTEESKYKMVHAEDNESRVLEYR